MPSSASRDRPIRLAILLQDLEFGGTQRYAVQLLSHLNRDLFAPELWVLRGGDDMVPTARATGVPITRFSEASWVGPGSLSRLMVMLVQRRPDILYTLTVVPNIWGRIFGRAGRVPVILSGYRSLFPKQHEGLLWRLCDRVVCNAEMLKEVMVEHFRVPAQRIVVIHNAVDAEYFLPEPTRRGTVPTVCSVGRLVKEKDPLTLLEAFRLTAEHVPTSRFEIVGDGPFRRQMEEYISAHNLADRIHLIPGTDDVLSRLQHAWIFTLASQSEASPNVIIEAMATGLPVVATRVGGIPELVDNGRTGTLVPPRDPQATAEALITLLKDEVKRGEMGMRARARALERHSVRSTVPKLEKVMLEVLLEKEEARNGDNRSQ